MQFIAALLAAGAGAGREKVNTPTLSAADFAIDPSDANASIVWRTDGEILRNTLIFDTWLLFGDSSDYELFVSGTGDTPGGTGILDDWQNMGDFDLGYALAQNSLGSKSFSGTYQIRIASSGTVIGSGTLSLSVTVDAE